MPAGSQVRRSRRIRDCSALYTVPSRALVWACSGVLGGGGVRERVHLAPLHPVPRRALAGPAPLSVVAAGVLVVSSVSLFGWCGILQRNLV